jgi:hypothetical protein
MSTKIKGEKRCIKVRGDTNKVQAEHFIEDKCFETMMQDKKK